MKFWLMRSNNVVTVDDAPMAVDLSDVPANIYIVDWGGNNGTILYTDRVGVRETFSDPSPYQTYINRWMLAAENPNQNEIGTPSVQPITLVQAQAVKTSLINVLFDMKRQAPIAVTIVLLDEKGEQVGTTSTTYDASDENVGNMQSQAIGEITGQISGSGNSLANDINTLTNNVATLRDSMNASISGINANFATHDNYITTYNNGITDHNNNVSTFNSAMGTTINGFNVNTQYMNTSYVDSINGTLNACSVVSIGGTPTWQPYAMPHQGMADSTFTAGMPGAPTLSSMIGAMAGVTAGTLPPSASGPGSTTPTQNALHAILTRRNTLKTTQTTKQGQVTALTSVAAVAAYDITAGW